MEMYYKMGVIGMLMMCASIPIFFISSTDISGHFEMTGLSWTCIITGIMSTILMVTSYIRANQIINERQKKPEVDHE